MKPKQANINQIGFVVLKSIVDVNFLGKSEESFIDLPVEIDFNVLKAEDDESKIRVVLDLYINVDRSHDGYKIELCTGGEYQFSDEIEPDSEEYTKLMLYSALPCLINQTRLFLETITSFYPMGKYILPMFDMKDLLDKKTQKDRGD